MIPLTDEDLLALNVYCEAAGEPTDGQAAIARVTINRMKLRFMSDGTMVGTVLAKDQFSWAWFAFDNNNKYVRVCETREDATARAATLFAKLVPAIFAPSRRAALAVSAGGYSGTLYDALTDDTVNYCNPRILTKPPTWAIPEKLVCSIGHHDFYRS